MLSFSLFGYVFKLTRSTQPKVNFKLMFRTNAAISARTSKLLIQCLLFFLLAALSIGGLVYYLESAWFLDSDLASYLNKGLLTEQWRSALPVLLIFAFAVSWRLARKRLAQKEAYQRLIVANRELEVIAAKRDAQLATMRAGQEKLIGQLQLQSVALNGLSYAIVVTDSAAIIEWVNSAFSELTGFAFDEAVGKHPNELMRSGLQSPAFYRTMWHTLKTGQVWQGEIVIKRRDGSPVANDMTITPISDDQGCVSHFVALLRKFSTCQHPKVSSWLEGIRFFG
jgi:PAS domain S-box-containing protein